jgi:phosphate butyryltransferase
LANAKSAGIIVGAKAPIVLTSRADSDDSKLNSIALGVLMASI